MFYGKDWGVVGSRWPVRLGGPHPVHRCYNSASLPVGEGADSLLKLGKRVVSSQ